MTTIQDAARDLLRRIEPTLTGIMMLRVMPAILSLFLLSVLLVCLDWRTAANLALSFTFVLAFAAAAGAVLLVALQAIAGRE